MIVLYYVSIIQMYTRDIYNKEILLKGTQQVMMAWEKPYMEALIDKLDIKPEHDVLEIGFGLGYSAEAIQYYKPKSHTVVEIDEAVIAKIRELDWTKNITVQHGAWQDLIKEDAKTYSRLKKYDRIFFDDFPMSEGIDSDSLHRLLEFVDRVMQFHCKTGAKISFYLENTLHDIIAKSKKYRYDEDRVFVHVPKNCRYITPGVRAMYLPLLTLEV